MHEPAAERYGAKGRPVVGVTDVCQSVRLLDCLQAGIKPPTFVLFCNDAKLFPDDYKKFIERQFRWVLL
jgi:predicted GTPase